MSAPGTHAFEWLTYHATRNPDSAAVGTPAGWTSYGSLETAMRRLASEFAAIGVGPGSFVLFSLPASAASVAASLAVQALGACVVEIHRESDLRTIASVLEQTGARHALVHGRDASRWIEPARLHRLERLVVAFPGRPPAALQQVLSDVRWSWVSEHEPLTLEDETASPNPASADPQPGPTWDPDPNAPALLVFTSGTTGTPRGVIQTHANILANTSAIVRYLGLGSDDRALSILPLSYCFGRSIVQTHLFAGGSVFFDHRFTFPRVVMGALAEQKCTGFYGVPLTFELLRRQIDPKDVDLSALRYVAQAGGAMHAETTRWVRKAFAPARLFVMYGQTEATARLSFLPPERANDKEGSIGRGLENVELRVVDAHGNELPPGEVGELVARGPSITPGYFGAPEETAEILRNGWLWTGDLASRDDEGFVFLMGRSKDMLKLGGHRVSAAEIEATIAEYPGVGEVAVVGAPDPIGGEVSVAFVVGNGPTIDPADLRRFCRQRLPAFKVPQQVHVVEELPRTSSGKVAKSTLREVARK